MAIDKSEFENYPPDERKDETDVNLRAYFWNMPEEKLAQYDRNWSDEKVNEWDGNFTSDGDLMLICSERDVDVTEYRKVLHQYFDFLKEKEDAGPISAKPVTYP